MKYTELDTPSLLIDKSRLLRNLADMQRYADENGAALRPHTKTHKCPEIAKMQLEAGACGIAVAKTGEAEVMAQHGIHDIFIANEIVGDLKLRRIAKLAEDGVTISVSGKPRLKGRKVVVSSDISSAAFFIAAAALIPGSETTFENVSLNPTRTGILHVLCKMGGNVSIVPDPNESGEQSGTIRVKYAPLRAIELTEEDVPSIIDELPLVAMLAASADGTSKITGAAELRVKETDRIAVTAQELRKFGVEIEELEDGMIIKGRENWNVQTQKLDSHGDHRIGMMDAIAALKADCEMELENEAAIDISYPTFFSDLAKITGGVKND